MRDVDIEHYYGKEEVRFCLLENNKEKFFANVSKQFAKNNFVRFHNEWVTTGQKPYGFVSEDAKAL